jgi:hypothetical protein
VELARTPCGSGRVSWLALGVGSAAEERVEVACRGRFHGFVRHLSKQKVGYGKGEVEESERTNPQVSF